MTLPQNVADAVNYIDTSGFKGAPIYESSWKTIRAELNRLTDELADYKNTSLHAADDCMAKDAEIARLNDAVDRLQQLWSENAPAVEYKRRALLAESRLAAANALLRDIKDWDVNAAQGTCLMVPLRLRKRIKSQLQGAGDEA